MSRPASEEPPAGPPLPFGAAIASVLSSTVTGAPVAAPPPPGYDTIQGRAILLVVFPVIGFFCILSLALYCAQLVRNRAAQRRLGSNYLLNLAAMHDVVTAIQRRQQQQQSSAAALGGSGTSGASQRLVVLTRRPGTSNPQPPLQLDDAAAAALAAAVLGSNQRGVREALRRLYVQHRLMEDPGYQLTSWADVQLAWAVWAAEEAAGAGSSAPAVLAPRCKRFPGLSQGLIEELPTWAFNGSAAIPATPCCSDRRRSSDSDSGGCAAQEVSAPADGSGGCQQQQLVAEATKEGQQQQQQQQQQQRPACSDHLSITVEEPSSSSGRGGGDPDVGMGPAQPAAADDCDDLKELSTSCSICLEAFAQGELLAGVPRCGHAFHRTCLTSWLLQSGTCPNCRQVVLPAPQRQGTRPTE